MKFPNDDRLPTAATNVSASGAIAAPIQRPFVPRLPSTWPTLGPTADAAFVDVLHRLFVEGMLAELESVCSDVIANNAGSLQGRGHVIAVAMMSILESVSQFASTGERQFLRIPAFVRSYFPPEYHPIADDLNDFYRNGLIHEWFMRKVALLPGREPLTTQSNGSPVLGLLTFKEGLTISIERFLEELRTDASLRDVAAIRYRTLQQDVRG